MESVIVVDTGFVLSVATVDGLPPMLGERWSQRTAWTTDVRSELQHRDRRPGAGVPPGLARKAINSSGLWLPDPVALTYDEQEEAAAIAERLGGIGDGQHLGEAAGVVLARSVGGVIATEDYNAADLIHSQFSIRVTCISAVLQRLHADGKYDEAAVVAALDQLNAKNRPNVDGLEAREIIDGSWVSRMRRRRGR